MRKLLAKIALAGLITTASTGAFAGVYTQSPDPASVAQGAQVNVDILFAGDGATQDTQLDLGYNATVFPTVTAVAQVAGSVCVVNSGAQLLRIVPPSGAGNPLTSTATAYCRFQMTAAAAAPAGNYDFTQLLIECDAGACTRSGTFRVTVTGGAVNTPPTIAYNPATGSTITYTGAGTASAIIATPSGGSGSGAAATTTVGACTITGGGAAFPTTNIAQLSFVGNTVAPQNIALPNCVPQAAATNATLTCPETAGAGAAVNRTWTLTCPAAAANTPPSIAYNPATGSTITYTGGGTASAIVATPSGGAGSGAAATTTVGACTITGGGAAFPTTNIAQLSFVGNTVAPQNIVLPNCVPQAAATNATLTCPESAGGGAAVNRTWTLTCPAGVANTPPTITYNPVAGSTVNIASNGNSTIQVGCPTDGAACNGSGSGLAATSRLEQLTVAYAGPPFSPTPNDLSCAFVTEGGTGLGATMDFAATAADTGDIRCACTQVFTAEPYTVTVSERIPANAGAVTATRTFNVVCGQGLTCGSITATPASGTANLNNGGAAVQVTSINVAGISAGVNQTVTCTVSGASAGSTFTATTVPSPLVLNSVTSTGTVSATCTNSNTTTATATLTCSSVGSGVGCPTLAATYTLSCPGQNAPPPVSTVPVPALSEQGRILLAALVLLLGLGVVGFRLRG